MTRARFVVLTLLFVPSSQLISEGAEVNRKDYDARTPLHICVDENSISVTRALLDAGADPTVKDRWGNSPLDAAQQRKNEAITEMMLKALRDRGFTSS